MEISDVEIKPSILPISPQKQCSPKKVKIKMESDDDEYIPGKKKKKSAKAPKSPKKENDSPPKPKKKKKAKKKKQEHKLWTCRRCLQEFDTRKGLTEHSKIHSEDTSEEHTFKYDEEQDLYYCNTCSAEYQSQVEVEQHISKVHEEFYACEVCNHTSKKAYTFAIHMKSHSNDDMMVCPLCSYSTQRRTCLQTHINRVHYHKFYYTCGTCGKGFNDSVIFKEHNNEHLGIKPFLCVVCGKAFCYSRYMNIHQVRHHTVYIEGTLHKTQCSICLKVFSKVETLLKHITSKHKHGEDKHEKRHLCDLCGKGFGSSDKLKIHYRIHTGEKPFHCRFCEKCFTKKDYLIMHERVHTGEKPYPCEYCGKCFNQACSLRIHVRGHTGERPYMCQFCNGGYISRGSLNLHMKTCSGMKIELIKNLTPETTISGISWQCCHCNQKFANLSKLKTHMEHACKMKNKPQKPELKRHPKSIATVKSLLSKLPNIRTKIIVNTKKDVKTTKNTKTLRPQQKKPKAAGNLEKKCFWPCSQCPQIFSSEVRLGEHLLKCSRNIAEVFIKPRKKKPESKAPSPFDPYYFDRFRNVYICNRCLKEFNVKSSVEEHLESDHPGFKCIICAKSFESIVDLGYHSASHSKAKEMTCPCCAFKSTVKSKLAFHIQTEHVSSSDLINAQDVSFTCVVCGKAFYNRRKLWHHQKNYHRATIEILPSMGARLDGPILKTASTEPKVYLCDTCGKDFNSKYRLERHQRAMHQGLRPFICRFCARAFTGKDTMQKHERIHTGEKPYSCEYCGKCFRQPGPFSVHLRIHTGERPYVCKFCKKGFITNQSRKSHSNNCVGKDIDYNYLNMLNY